MIFDYNPVSRGYALHFIWYPLLKKLFQGEWRSLKEEWRISWKWSEQYDPKVFGEYSEWKMTYYIGNGCWKCE